MFIEANGMEISLFIYFFLYLLDLKRRKLEIFISDQFLTGIEKRFCGFLNNKKSANDCNLCLLDVK